MVFNRLFGARLLVLKLFANNFRLITLNVLAIFSALLQVQLCIEFCGILLILYLLQFSIDDESWISALKM